MKNHRSVAWTVFLWMVIVPVAVLAQDNCPVIVQSALKVVDDACQATGRNQACYGNIQLLAEPQTGVSDFAFAQQGDIADVGKIKTLTLSALNTQTDEWGVALMKIQANLPDTLPGQNVTMLLFGDVAITDAAESAPPPVLLDVTAAGSANVRGGPSTSQAVVGRLTAGQALKADGRNEAADWLRIQLEDGTIGWVAAQLVTVTGDASTLPVKDNNDVQEVPAAPQFGPMQSFYFKSGAGDAPCAEAPDSGILIQTPEGAGEIKLSVNGVDVSLGSTGYFQAQASGEMTVSIVEGQGTIASQNVTRTVPAGSRVRVPLDANLVASGPPSQPEPYNNADLTALPVGHMPRVVKVATALTQAEIDALTAVTLPVSGDWAYEVQTATYNGMCYDSISPAALPRQFDNEPVTPPRNRVVTLNITDAFSAKDFDHALTPSFEPPASAVYQNPEPGLYTADWSDSSGTYHEELRFTSPTQAEGSTSLSWENPQEHCTFATTYTLAAQ